MKANINRAAFLRALRIVKPATIRKSFVGGFISDAVVIKINQQGDVLWMACAETTVPISIITSIPAEVDENPLTHPGVIFAVTLRVLQKLVSALRSDCIELSIDDRQRLLRIQGGEIVFTAQCIDLERATPMHERYLFCETPAPGLFTAASRVWFSASKEEARPVLQGISFNERVVATDGFRVAMLPAGVEGVHGIIPAQILRMAWHLFGKREVKANVDGNRFAISDGTTTLGTNLIEGNFPNVEVIIPKRARLVIELKSSELFQATRAVLACAGANKASPFCIMGIDQNDDGIVATIQMTHEGEYGVTTKLSGNLISRVPDFSLPFAIALNAQYIDDVAARVSGRIQLVFNANNTPILMRPLDLTEDFTAVVMPVHIDR